MTDIYVNQHERAPLTDEAREIADTILSKIITALDDGQPYEPIPGLIAPESYHEKVRQEAREKQRQLGESIVHFSNARRPYNYLYEALLAGYNPSEEQIEAEAQEGGHNYLWDEVLQLHLNHYDVYEIYNTGEPLWESNVDIEVLRDILGVMYMRGKDYRSFGYGFPWRSDNNASSEIEGIK